MKNSRSFQKQIFHSSKENLQQYFFFSLFTHSVDFQNEIKSKSWKIIKQRSRKVLEKKNVRKTVHLKNENVNDAKKVETVIKIFILFSGKILLVCF